MMNVFFVCPNCGNNEEFKIYTSNFQGIKQSIERGMQIEESNILPNLRKEDNYIECQLCFRRFEYEGAVALGKRYIQMIQRLQKSRYAASVLFRGGETYGYTNNIENR